MNILAKIGQLACALGVLLLFVAVSTQPVDAAKKKVVRKTPVKQVVKQLKQQIPWKEINELVKVSEMEKDRAATIDEYYFISAKLEKRLHELGLSVDAFHLLLEEGLNRPPEAPQRVNVMKNYRIDADTVGVWYRATYMTGYEGSRDDMAFVTKTKDGWKIDPEHSWWFINKGCYRPPVWNYRKVNATCYNSEKSFRGKNGSSSVIGKQVQELVKRIEQGRAMMRAAEQAASANEVEDTIEQGG